MRESFIMYKSFFDAGEQIKNKNDRLLFYEAILKFALFKEETELQGVAKGMFFLVKPQLEANIRKFENGKQPKKTRSKIEANDKQDVSKIEANVNDNVNVNENDNDECKITPVASPPSSSFLLLSECRKKYDTEYVDAKLSLCDTHNILHKNLVIFQNVFDKELTALGKKEKEFTDYVDHFAKWLNKKGQDGRKKMISDYYEKNTPKQSISEKYA